MKWVLLLFALLISGITAEAQSLLNRPPVSPMREHLQMLNNAKYIDTRPGAAKATYAAGKVYDTSKWSFRVDSLWGIGIPTLSKLDLFDGYWKNVDSFYAGFTGRPHYNWDSIVNAMRTEISGGVSEGRFAGIIGKLIAYINDGHSNFLDQHVSYYPYIYPGMPLFRSESGMFGACITTLNDSTPMVYTANAGHPFGLQPGDLVLGYNGIPWKKLVQVMLNYQLPLSMFRAGTEAATWHRYMQAAGENWYLFDTINIQKCDGSKVSFPTSLMMGKNYQDFCLEELPVKNIHTITYGDYVTLKKTATSGVLPGTRIGYVALLDCMDFSGDTLLRHVKRLVEDSLVHGLVLDIRTNGGGTVLAYYKTYMYLCNGPVTWLGGGYRPDPTDRYYMSRYPGTFDIIDTDAHHFDNKIAILAGPGAGSAGDMLSVLFKHLPDLKTFGKSTEGAYGAIQVLTVPYAGYWASRQIDNFFNTDDPDPTHYLTHTEFPVDSPMWYTQASLCSGRDNILEAAVRWIEPKLEVNNIALTPSVKVFPNPTGGRINMLISSPVAETISVRLCNVIGATIKMANANLVAGEQSVLMDISNMQLPPGSYYLILHGNTLGTVTRKVAIIN